LSWGGGDVHSVLFERIISLENLFAAWQEFRKGKTKKRDVQEFEFNLEDNVFVLYKDLRSKTYQHGPYESFYVCDPKRRHIHKPSVRDRLLHHAIFRIIEPIFEKQFIFDVWSCRKGKGTHHAVERFQKLAWKLSRNNTKTVWVLKLDIRKFFESVDQEILISILRRAIRDEQVMSLLQIIIKSFPSGIPLGNLTSQLFANVYLNEMDRLPLLAKERGGVRYLRYCDDFMLLHRDRRVLELILPRIHSFLFESLHLSLHPRKIILDRYHHGIDFLGFVCFPHHRILRTKTKRRMLRRVNLINVASYRGLVAYARASRLLVFMALA